MAGAGLSLLISPALSLWAHVVIAAGVEPEAMIAADWLGPVLAIFGTSAWAGRQSKVADWELGVGIALILVALWLLAWCYFMARWNLAAWPSLGLGTLTWRHGKAWLLVLLFGALGGRFGQRKCVQQRSFMRALCGGFLLFTLSLPFYAVVQRMDELEEAELVKGVIKSDVNTAPDGTTFRLLEIYFAIASPLHFGIYDADSDDDKPFDDRNTTWLGQSVDFVFDKLQRHETARGRDVICIVNGGFFGGSDNWTAHHEAPISSESVVNYNTRILESEWPQQAWTFAISRAKDGKPRFHLLPDAKFNALPQYEMALGGVRALRKDGKSLELQPGMGGTKLRTSRTSIGWSADDGKFFVLSVRDPDGEAASVRQKKLGRVQTGGWDVRDVQHFWEKRGVPNAVLFDGGESTQLVYGGNAPIIVRCGYTLARTLGYWRQRPLRVVLPLLPPEMNGGVLNYFYITAPKQE